VFLSQEYLGEDVADLYPDTPGDSGQSGDGLHIAHIFLIREMIMRLPVLERGEAADPWPVLSALISIEY
jgi:hypothetical protein